MDAPLARALLKRSPGDEVTLELAGGRKTWLLLEVSYEVGLARNRPAG
jgi:transcription elongation factor GreB